MEMKVETMAAYAEEDHSKYEDITLTKAVIERGC